MKNRDNFVLDRHHIYSKTVTEKKTAKNVKHSGAYSVLPLYCIYIQANVKGRGL